MNNDNMVPFSRDFKARPEQFIHKLNKLSSQLSSNSNSNAIWSRDKSKVIVVGEQPNGSWGIVEYSVSGDLLNVINVVL